MKKEDGIITITILSLFVLLFEYARNFDLNIKDGIGMAALYTFCFLLFKFSRSSWLNKYKKIKNGIRAFAKSFPSLLFACQLFTNSQNYFLSGHTVTMTEQLPAALNYYATQTVVIAHYLGNFILPLNLGISSGFTIYSSVINPKIFFSCILILALIIIAFVTSRDKEKRPIAFGIAWFFLALVPSGFIVKGGELSNDHRTFFPYIGLVLSLAWWLRLVYIKYGNTIRRHKFLPKIIVALYFFIISLHAYGTYKRNIVWSSTENLWHDAAIKNPNDPIALMNYGLGLMDQRKYDETLGIFERVLKLRPEWAYIYVNMGVLKDNMGNPQEAEPYFKDAIHFQPFYPVGYYYYGRFLQSHGRKTEAINILNEGLKVSPGDAQLTELLNIIKADSPEAKSAEISKMAAYADQNPTAEHYVNLSLVYYQNRLYKECIETCEKALKLDASNAMAYNNMCASYNGLGQWAKAVEACKRSLQIDSTLKIARENLIWAEKNLK